MSDMNKQLMEAGPTLNLRRNGWVKAPELDFSDDGNRFHGYYYDPKKSGDKRFPTSKLISDGNAYISVHYTNSKSGRSIYFDDLNGVDYQYAIEHLPDLAKKIDSFIAKLDDEGETVVELTPQQYQDVLDKCVRVYTLTGGRYYEILTQVLKKMGIDKADIEQKQQYQLSKDAESAIRNAKKDDPQLVKEMAVAVMKEVMKEMTDRSGYNYNRRYESRPAKSLDDALKSVNPYIKLSDGEYHWFKDFTDETKNKIERWVRRKLTTLYDFDEE